LGRFLFGQICFCGVGQIAGGDNRLSRKLMSVFNFALKRFVCFI
jgi:hypothetical protein